MRTSNVELFGYRPSRQKPVLDSVAFITDHLLCPPLQHEPREVRDHLVLLSILIALSDFGHKIFTQLRALQIPQCQVLFWTVWLSNTLACLIPPTTQWCKFVRYPLPHNKSPPNVIVSNYTTYHFLKFCGLAGLQLGRVSLLGVFPEAVFNGRALLGFEASCEPLVIHYS